MPGELRVVATAGHVDHGKSSLILRLTGIDPDRWAEEKRRGLTIDLGYAWCTLPSGREIGFVDVPGHERFIANMLAGVGPVRLVLFVVAADEGWKPQSEEHLEILDVLGVRGGVVALTKRDLVDAETLEIAVDEVRERLAGTALAGAPILPVSSQTGEGIEDLAAALDAMLAAAGPAEDTRARLFVDRVFTIRGAGTVVTGTLSGDCLSVGDDVELYPTGAQARIRSLQTHKTTEDRACPVSRVAANLVGATRVALERGNVLAAPGAWRPTRAFEARIRPVRGRTAAVTSRGAFILYSGATASEVRLRLYETAKLEPGREAFARITTTLPLVLDVGDRFVLRDAGRGETVAGGVVLDVAPPARSGANVVARLQARAAASRDELPAALVAERGAVPAAEVAILTGSRATGGIAVGEWQVSDALRAAVDIAVTDMLVAYHAEHPLDQGADLVLVRRTATRTLRAARAPGDDSLADGLLADLDSRGITTRDATTIRLSSHRVELETRTADVERLLVAIGGEHEATPPTVKELIAAGIARDVIEAAAREDVVIRLTPDLIVTPELVARAEAAIRRSGDAGITVSAIRETLGTSRRYAIPLMEWFDLRGITRRDGDVRHLRDGVRGTG
ncbi:MAG: selenocysteine-specific translation elongation factor [Actinomycetota bacterium]